MNKKAVPSRKREMGESKGRLLDDPAFKEAMRLTAESGRLTNEDIRAMRAGRRQITAAGFAVALAVGTGSWLYMQPFRAAPDVIEFATAPGEMREFRAQDGSVLRLNGASRVTLTLARDHRKAKLVAGEAFFDIRHENRPFTVRAARSEVRVLGTAFDVDMTRTQVALSVYRGAVRFSDVDTAQAVVVKAGWRSRLRDKQISSPERFDPAQGDWRQGWIDSSGMTLSDLVEILNRRGGRPIEAPPTDLGNLEISGRFRTDQPRELLSSLGAVYGFTVTERKNAITIEGSAAN